ncbi:hypothetical protein C8R47DRAFT_1313054 [Mycena vitilis]|nr:hypothetical protein C8R47DRAFT_1313054 [Mycena vitilis]
MPISLGYPNYLLSTRHIARYNADYSATRVPPAPAQFPPRFTLQWTGHRSPAAVPFPAVTSSASSAEFQPVAPPPSPSSMLASATSSTSGSSSASTSVVAASRFAMQRILDHKNGWSGIDSVVGDATTRSLMRMQIASQIIYHVPSAVDVLPILHLGKTSYRIRPGFMYQIATALARLAEFIHCASNDHNPWISGGPPDLPLSMDQSGLEESALPIPGVSLFRGYSIQSLEQRRFSSVEEALNFIRMAIALYNYYLLWIANQIRHFLRFGYDSKWNWGAPLSMAKTEFLRRNLPHFNIDSHGDLEYIMGHQILRNTADFACAYLISPRDNRLIRVHRAGQVVLAIWPLSQPAYNPAEVFLVHHLGEIHCTVRVLGQILVDNQPSDGSSDDSSDDDDSYMSDADESDMSDDDEADF